MVVLDLMLIGLAVALDPLPLTAFLVEPLTAAGQRVLELLPTSTYLQALQRAVDLRLV